MNSLTEQVSFVKGLPPAADRWNTNPATDIVSMRNHNKCTFLVHQEGGTTGTATFTVEACSDVSGTGATAIPFGYRVGAAGAGAGGDAMGARVEATASGFTSTAASDRLYLIEVEANELLAAKPFVRLKCTEAVNDPVNGSVEIMLSEGRYQGASAPTAIA